MTEDRFVIVGASIGGMTAAEEVRKRSAAEIVLIDGDREVPYDKTVLSKGELIHPASAGVGMRTPEQFAEQNIDLRTGVWAASVDPDLKEVHLSDGSRLSYSKLLIATGATPVVPEPNPRIEDFNTHE